MAHARSIPVLPVICVLAIGLYGQVPTSPAKATLIDKIYVDSEGVVHVVEDGGTDRAQSKEKDQVSCSQPKISDDKRTAGWLVDFPNCCTSYPISLQLLLYQPGKLVQHLGDGMLIADWHFLDGGKQVAFSTNTVHGDMAPHYELHDVDSGRLLSHWNGHLNAKSPKWTRGLSD
jgi:hypothetical protein